MRMKQGTGLARLLSSLCLPSGGKDSPGERPADKWGEKAQEAPKSGTTLEEKLVCGEQ